MAESEVAALTSKQKRALRLMTDGPAHGLRDQLLDVLSDLAHFGFVERKPYSERHNGRLWDCYETRLTAKGKVAASAALEEYRRGR